MRIVIKNLPISIKEEEIRKEFSRHGTITDLHMVRDQLGHFRRVCFIGYSSQSSAEEAIRYHNRSFIKNSRISVSEVKKESKYKSKKKELMELLGKPMEEDEQTITGSYFKIIGVPSVATLDQLRSFFSIYGDIHHITAECIEFRLQVTMPSTHLFMGKYINVRPSKRPASQKNKEYYNALFFDFSTVVKKICDEEKVRIEDLVDLKDGDLGARIALLETHLVDQTKQFLEENSINFENFSGKRNKKSLLVRNYDALNEIGFAIQNCKVKMAPSKCVAILEFPDEESALSAYKKLNLKRAGDKAIYCEFMPLCSEDENPIKESQKFTDKIVIKNVPFQATEKDIRFLLESQVKVINIRLPLKRDGTHRGFCFVTLENKESAELVCRYFGNSTHLYGRRLVIQPAQN
ncbi:Multiple RNA-binding domain-containing protein 1 [Astathelohania contejeani]|uniref:Multiple RNA-binding domain-containing protein 1 n=1 Tax=Astathelohania contejeani TaxID=164912 RepID=A0ABQ7HYL9_9MICR|nr:Multiple RNA-binding domain-containing protein 1 [Thelohania contejeani]